MTQARSDRVAILDIGTNTLLLLVAEITPSGQVERVHEVCEFGRLGQGLDASGQLHPDSVTRSLEIVERYRQLIDQHGATRVRAIGTQALREARNARDFVDPAQARLGAAIEIVAGEREAELAYRAARQSLPDLAGRRFVIVDVGGGSTEIICSTGDGAAMATCQSLPIGAVRLHERHLATDPPTRAELDALDRDIDAHLARVDLPTGAVLVATAGTATSLVTMALAMDEYDPDRVHGHPLFRHELEAQLARLTRATHAERRTFAGLPPGRADLMAAGSAIFARVCERMNAESLVISDRGIRWGVAYEMAET